MKGIKVKFKNRPVIGGFETFEINDCLIANNGSPNSERPQVIIHLPKTDDHKVDGAFVEYEGHDYHIIGTTVSQMDDNAPTRWDRYCIGERVRAL